MLYFFIFCTLLLFLLFLTYETPISVFQQQIIKIIGIICTIDIRYNSRSVCTCNNTKETTTCISRVTKETTTCKNYRSPWTSTISVILIFLKFVRGALFAALDCHGHLNQDVVSELLVGDFSVHIYVQLKRKQFQYLVGGGGGVVR